MLNLYTSLLPAKTSIPVYVPVQEIVDYRTGTFVYPDILVHKCTGYPCIRVYRVSVYNRVSVLVI